MFENTMMMMMMMMKGIGSRQLAGWKTIAQVTREPI